MIPLQTRLNQFFKHRTELERILFEKVRRTLSWLTIVRRRAAARAIAGEAPFTIDAYRGFMVLPPHALPEAREVVALTGDLSHGVDLGRSDLSKKARTGLMAPLIDSATLTLQSPFLRLALRRDVIATVSAYLGIMPVIAHLNVYYSAAGSGDARLSQLFHCDADGTSQIKIFVLCSDVTPSDGPLTLVDARTSGRVRRRLGYRYGAKLNDARLAGMIQLSDHHPVLGPAGTVCVVDTTRCFHFGSRVEPGADPRIVVMIQYLVPASFMLPRDHRVGSPFRHLATPAMSNPERLVLGAA